MLFLFTGCVSEKRLVLKFANGADIFRIWSGLGDQKLLHSVSKQGSKNWQRVTLIGRNLISKEVDEWFWKKNRSPTRLNFEQTYQNRINQNNDVGRTVVPKWRMYIFANKNACFFLKKKLGRANRLYLPEIKRYLCLFYEAGYLAS